MCGIAGWTGLSQTIDLRAMLDALRHRGPDELGLWQEEGVGLGIARLSIVDVAEGHQPCFSSDGSVVVVCNGEIYNHRALARKLESDGVTLRSRSDIEVIAHLYERHGLGFVEHLRGMFAIALWDRSQGRLVLARDRVGKKPIYFSETRGGLLFASEVRALLATGWRREVDLDAINHVLAFDHLPVDAGAYEGLRSVPPGCMVIWQAGQTQVERYWEWQASEVKFPFDEALHTLRSALQEAVELRMVSERPLGSFLSGGIDSTIVTALMAKASAGTVRTFSIGFEDPSYNEAPHAAQVAAFLGTEHTELIVKPEPTSMLTAIGEAFDQPFADSSAVPTLLLSEMASRDVVVALAGDGGDEGFGGYLRYWAAPRLQRFNAVSRLLGPGAGPIDALGRRLGSRSISRVSRAMRPAVDLGDRYRQIMTWIPPFVRAEIWTPEAIESMRSPTPEERFDAIWSRSAGAPPLDRLRAHDIAMYLPGDLLTKVDISSMAHSIEVRSPFLDQEVLKVATHMPTEALIRGRTTKRVLRELAYELVPRDIVDRPKMGFGIPRAAWLRGPLSQASRDLLLDETARSRGWFNPTAVRRLLDLHDGGSDQDQYLWPLLMVEIWARRWVDPS